MIQGYVFPGRVSPLLGAEDVGLLLRFAHEQHPLVAVERRQVLLRDIVLPLTPLEGHEVDPFRDDKALDGVDELLRHRRHHHRRRDARPQLRLHEPDEPSARLQRGHVRIQIHPVDGLQLEGHVIREDLGDAFGYHDGGAPGERGPCGHRPDRVHYLGAGCKPCHAPGAPLFLTRPCLRPARASAITPHARRSEAGPR